MPSTSLSVPPEIPATGEWVPALIAQQLSGMSAYVLRGAVARGEVRIQPTHAMTRYLYHRDDCERLRMQGTAASHAVTARGAA